MTIFVKQVVALNFTSGNTKVSVKTTSKNLLMPEKYSIKQLKSIYMANPRKMEFNEQHF